MKDKKIHIVAPPGSGKTTLGIELIRRLGQPCLILSPSIVIRQQWFERIQDAFLTEKGVADVVMAVTKVFEAGYIKVLIGTKALFGEGWDSPCINSLILAGFVGSFVLSNQMRGRASSAV